MMNKINIKLQSLTFTGLSLFMLMLCLTACKKQAEVLPDDTENVAYNFYSASDVMSTAYSPGQMTLAAYIDKYQEQSEPLYAGTGYSFPTISFGFKGGQEYPATNSGNDGSINYVRYNAGDHHLFFTDAANAVVLDTSIKTQAKTFNGLYLADDIAPADAPAKYKLVVAEEDRKATAGKTGVRFVHLSADAGKLTCNIKKANGELSGIQAGEMAFGEVSDYQFFGSDDVASGGLLRFTLSNAANGINFSTGVPFNPGRNYVIVILGFRTDQRRQVAIGKNTDGSINNEIITIPNNLRAEIRRSY